LHYQKRPLKGKKDTMKEQTCKISTKHGEKREKGRDMDWGGFTRVGKGPKGV